VSEPAWKKVERRIAEYWGGRRTPLSGSNSGHDTSSDAINLPVPAYIEVKHGAGCPKSVAAIRKLFDEVEGKALLEHKTPFLILHEKRMQEPIENWPVWCRARVFVAADTTAELHAERVIPLPQELARRSFFIACCVPEP
jgi:hypothetical protein